MKRLITIFLLFSGSIAFAQSDTNAHEIPWKPIKKEDILWKKRVWREIEIYEQQNAPLRYNAASPQEDVFANVLISGINAGLFKAFAADTGNDDLRLRGKGQDEVFAEKVDKWVYSDDSLVELNHARPLTKEEVNKLIACDPSQLSTIAREYINSSTQHPNDSGAFTIEEYQVKERRKKRMEKKIVAQDYSIYDASPVASCIYPQQIDRYGIIEDWIFDKAEGIMVVHIEAIAPMVKERPLFWLSYPDIRRYMNQYDLYAGKTDMKMTWDEYFESRQFSSKITRVSGPTSSSDH